MNKMAQWGPHLWGLLHTIAIMYDTSENFDNKHIMQCIKNIRSVIPCLACQADYDKALNLLEINPLPSTVFEWTVDLHNQINKRLQKPEITYAAALSKWKP